MSKKNIDQQHHITFDGIRHQDESGHEYWRARQLAKVLEYSEYRHFLPVITRAKAACRNSGQNDADHFEDILDMVAFHAWQQGERYENVPGFCYSAKLEDVHKHEHVLTPGRYVGAVEQEDDGEPFAEKMARLTAQWHQQRAQAAELDAAIETNLRGLGYGN